jgi:hypothetical protein
LRVVEGVSESARFGLHLKVGTATRSSADAGTLRRAGASRTTTREPHDRSDTMRRPQLTDADVGKHVVTDDGTVLGRVSAVNNGVPYVEFDPSVIRKVTTALSWQRIDDEDGLPLKTGTVERITGDQVRLEAGSRS